VKGEFSDMENLAGSLLTFDSFGWVNASYIYGMTLLSAHQRRALGALTKWDDYEKAMSNLGLI
jgi:alpha,alpha-trehalase